MTRPAGDGMGTDWRGLAADIRRAETRRGRERLGRFVIEGTRLHERALRAGAPLEAVLLSESFRRETGARIRALQSDLAACGCRLRAAPDAVLGELTGGRSSGAIVGLVRLPEPPTLERALRASASRLPTLLVAVEVEDPGNVGALVRTALAGGAAALAAVGISDPYHPRAVRTSMGGVLKLPILRFRSAAEAVEELDRLGLMKLAAVARGGTPLPEADLGGTGLAVLLGSEAFGLPEGALAAAERRVSVPMAAGVDSFSVNAAAAVILYEIGRRARRDG